MIRSPDQSTLSYNTAKWWVGAINGSCRLFCTLLRIPASVGVAPEALGRAARSTHAFASSSYIWRRRLWSPCGESFQLLRSSLLCWPVPPALTALFYVFVQEICQLSCDALSSLLHLWNIQVTNYMYICIKTPWYLLLV